MSIRFTRFSHGQLHISVAQKRSDVARGLRVRIDGNVLLTETIGEPKITDFSLATTAGGHIGTQSGQILGTPSYMAPEQAAGQKSRSRSYGRLCSGRNLIRVAHGAHPVSRGAPFETMALVLHQEPVPPRLLDPRIETDLQTICLKCLEKDPTRRYATALDLAEDLRRYLAGEPINAPTVNLMDRLSRTLCRNHKCGKFYMMTRADTETLREEIAAVLAPLGLRLSPAKTRIVHMSKGSTSSASASSGTASEDEQVARLHLHRRPAHPVAEGQDPCPDEQDVAAGPQVGADPAQPDHARLG